MKTWLTTDWHFYHKKLILWESRPENFMDLILKNLFDKVKEDDRLICLGDVSWYISKTKLSMIHAIPGHKILILGNHDKSKSCNWWMNNGFHYCCDSLKLRNILFTHVPVDVLPEGCDVNIHGHLHNPYKNDRRDYQPKSFHRLVSVELSNYQPVLLSTIIGD